MGVEDPRFEVYAELVRKYAARLDLVSDADLGRFGERHIRDSLRVLTFLDEALSGPCVDVGSGAGLPGIPLAIARPGRHWRLLEPRKLRAAFLEECVRELGLDAEVLPITAEGAARDPALAAAHALATERALAPPEEAAALLAPLLKPHGIGVLFVGRGAPLPEELRDAGEGLAIIRADGPGPRRGPAHPGRDDERPGES